MVTYTDKEHVVLVGVESTFNTPVATTLDLGLIQSFTPSDQNNIQKHYTQGKRDMQQLSAGIFTSTLDISAKYQHGRILQLMFGAADDNQEGATGDYTHVFVDVDNELGFGAKTLADNSLSFSIQNGFDNASGDQVATYAGTKVGTLTFNSAINDVLTWTANCQASSVDVSTTAGTKVISTLPVLENFRDSNSFGAASSEVAQNVLQSWSLTFTNTLQAIDGNGREHKDMTDNEIDTSFTFEKVFQDMVDYQRFLGGTTSSTETPAETSFLFNVNNGTALGSGRQEFKCKVLGQYEAVDRPVQLNGAVIGTFQGTGKLKYLATVDNITAYSS